MIDANVRAVAVDRGKDTWESAVPAVCNLHHTLCDTGWGDEKDVGARRLTVTGGA